MGKEVLRMATRHPLDLRIEIAELFDTGRLGGRVAVDDLALTVNATRYSVNRAILLLNFTTVTKRNRIMQSIPARYAPPRKWPDLSGRSSIVTHNIKDLFVSGSFTGRCSAEVIASLVGVSTESAGRSMKALRFKTVKRRTVKHVGWESAIIEPPRKWPEIFQRQRELRRAGLSAACVITATDSAAGIPDIIKLAIQRMDISDTSLNKRGGMKANIKEVIREIYRELTRDSIPRRQLAEWLGEDAEANVPALEARVRGLIRFAGLQRNKI